MFRNVAYAAIFAGIMISYMFDYMEGVIGPCVIMIAYHVASFAVNKLEE